MSKNLRYSVLTVFTLWTSITFAQDNIDPTTDSTGLAGDNFSLQGAMDLFKTATSLEDFESKLNKEDNAVNNLDLNSDGEIDYIRVIDNKQDKVHAIVLRVAVSATEDQDVAVIELGKDGEESATAQIVGDEELYGDSTIIEPVDEDAQIDGPVKGKGPYAPEYTFSHPRIIINVWFWPCVRFVYAPTYVIWISPWHWHYYPAWWSPWKRHHWYWHHQHCMHYHHYYHPCGFHRTYGAYTFYGPMRKTSPTVKTHYAPHRTAYYAHRTEVRKNGGMKTNNGGAIKQGGGGGFNGPKDGGVKQGGGNVKHGGGGMKNGGNVNKGGGAKQGGGGTKQGGGGAKKVGGGGAKPSGGGAKKGGGGAKGGGGHRK